MKKTIILLLILILFVNFVLANHETPDCNGPDCYCHNPVRLDPDGDEELV